VAVLVVALIGAVGYIVHLRGQVGQGVARSVAPVSQPAATAASGGAAAAPGAGAAVISEEAIAAVLTPAQQQAMVDALKTQTVPERKAWFQIQQSNAETGAVQVALQRVFEQAGWPTATAREPYPLKKGIFLLAGDDQPPPFVDTVIDAFNAAGIDAQYLTGYRAFYADRKQQNPNWHGPELAADQAFTIVIGSKPTPKPAGGESSSQQ
jgi:hypothetical protein